MGCSCLTFREEHQARLWCFLSGLLGTSRRWRLSVGHFSRFQVTFVHFVRQSLAANFQYPCSGLRGGQVIPT
jgi:hypothetical protein